MKKNTKKSNVTDLSCKLRNKNSLFKTKDTSSSTRTRVWRDEVVTGGIEKKGNTGERDEVDNLLKVFGIHSGSDIREIKLIKIQQKANLEQLREALIRLDGLTADNMFGALTNILKSIVNPTYQKPLAGFCVPAEFKIVKSTKKKYVAQKPGSDADQQVSAVTEYVSQSLQSENTSEKRELPAQIKAEITKLEVDESVLKSELDDLYKAKVNFEAKEYTDSYSYDALIDVMAKTKAELVDKLNEKNILVNGSTIKLVQKYSDNQYLVEFIDLVQTKKGFIFKLIEKVRTLSWDKDITISPESLRCAYDSIVKKVAEGKIKIKFSMTGLILAEAQNTDFSFKKYDSKINRSQKYASSVNVKTVWKNLENVLENVDDNDKAETEELNSDEDLFIDDNAQKYEEELLDIILDYDNSDYGTQSFTGDCEDINMLIQRDIAYQNDEFNNVFDDDYLEIYSEIAELIEDEAMFYDRIFAQEISEAEEILEKERLYIIEKENAKAFYFESIDGLTELFKNSKKAIVVTNRNPIGQKYFSFFPEEKDDLDSAV